MLIYGILGMKFSRGYYVLKHIYLVDCENVGTNYRVLVGNCYQAYYFTSGGRYINFELEPNEFEVHYTHTGCRDALDFVIDTYLGYLLARNPKNKVVYHIVSRDTGFDNIAGFWGSLGYCVRRTDPVGIDGIFLYSSKLSAGKVVKVRNIYNNWLKRRNSDFQELCELLYCSTRLHLSWDETVALGRYLEKGGII